MARQTLTNAQWEFIADIFPPPAKTGRPPTDRRKVMNAILWFLRAGSPWRDLPEAEFGPWETVYGLYDKWNSDGTLDKILERLRTARIDSGKIDEELWCIDGTIVRAHRCAAGGGKKGIPTNRTITH